MSTKRFMLGLLCLLLTFVWVAGAQAQVTYSLTGNIRGQIGNGLPVPITFAPAPQGPFKNIGGATAMGSAGGKLTIPPSQFKRAAAPFTLAVAIANAFVMQVRTNIGVTFPKSSAVFSAGGRSGPATASWCPLQLTQPNSSTPVNPPGVGTPNYNPGCLAPGPWASHGRLKYKATGAQFGGVALTLVTGTADVALNVNLLDDLVDLPCSFGTNPLCQVVFALANPQPTGVGGAEWGASDTSSGPAPPTGLYNVKMLAGGIGLGGRITYATSVGLGPGSTNQAANYGAPWTTGIVYVTATGTPSGVDEIFQLTGSDNRVNGVGSLSLVSGSVSERAASGPNANRGWMNLVLAQAVPGIPGANWAILALVMVMAGTAIWMIRRGMATSVE